MPPRGTREGDQYQGNINSEPVSHSYELIEFISILTRELLLKNLRENVAVVLCVFLLSRKKGTWKLGKNLTFPFPVFYFPKHQKGVDRSQPKFEHYFVLHVNHLFHQLS